MPSSYDFVVTTQGYIRDVKSGSVTYYRDKTGGGWRIWQGNQSRPRPAVLYPLPCNSTSRQYFNTMTYGKNQFYEAYRPLSFWEKSFVESSKDDTQGSQRARNAALNKLHKGHLNILVSLGESRETATYVASRMFTLARLLGLVSKGKFDDAAKLVGSELSRNASKRLRKNRDRYKNPVDLVSNSWLEYQFAIKPLVNDVYGAIEAYHSKLQAGSVVKTKGKSRNNSSGTIYRAGYIGVVKNQNLRTLQQLGLTNPALAAWNLVPLSFIVDWFLPISTLLQYLDATTGLTGVQSWGSKESWIQEVTLKSKKIEWKSQTYNRFISTYHPVIPVVGGNLNIGQLVTASALLQRFKR